MRFLHPLFSAIKYVGIPVMLLYILDETHEEKDPLLSLKIAGLSSLTSLAFITSSCFSLTSALYNPLVYQTLDMIDTYSFRKGLMEMQLGVNSVLGVMQTLISLLSFAVLFIPIKLLLTATFKNMKTRITPENMMQKLISGIIALIIFAIIYFLPYILNSHSFDMSTIRLPIASAIINYLVLSLISALIAAALAAVMGCGFVSPNKRVVLSAVVMLALLTILTAKPINISQYLLVKKKSNESYNSTKKRTGVFPIRFYFPIMLIVQAL